MTMTDIPKSITIDNVEGDATIASVAICDGSGFVATLNARGELSIRDDVDPRDALRLAMSLLMKPPGSTAP